MEYTKGEWYLLIDKENRHHIMSTGKTGDMEQNVAIMSVRPEAEPNARLIVTTVNACIKLNPKNPKAVAESISDLYEVCKSTSKWLEAFININNATHPIFKSMKMAIDRVIAEVEDK